MHTGGVCEWITRHRPEHPLYLIHPQDDGQVEAYPETAGLHQITYPDTMTRRPALMYPMRAIKGTRVSLPLHTESNILVAGSHFLPDVWPVLGQGKNAPGVIRAVYIHHIIQDMPRPRSLNTLLANSQEQFCFNLIRHRFDKIITVNQDVIEGLRRRGFQQPILLSDNFVTMHHVRARQYARKDITLAFCGRLVRQKGVDDFLEVCEALQARLPDFKAIMIGAGPELERLQKVIDTRQLHVELTGFVSQDRKFDILARSKLFVLPSIEEGWGIVIAESFSVGTPVLAYQLPVYAAPFGELLHSVPLSRKKQLTGKAIALLADYDKHPTTYNATQKKLTDHAKRFSRDSVAAKEFRFLMEDVHG